MPSPLGDLTILGRALQAQPSLLGFAKVLTGKNALPLAGKPPRVVVWTIGAANGTPDVPAISVSSAWMLMTAHFWATGDDNAFDLRTRWFQAMFTQAVAGGYFWKVVESDTGERWDQDPDTDEQGQEFEIDFLIRIDANKKPGKKGTVLATSLNRVTTITADVLAGDATIAVDATFELPASGRLYIDDEQLSYSGSTAGTFTGLVRGLNGTAAAAHASGTPVYVTPT